ncbi:hypothetical protein COBT_000192 [Conglomerata obtusa]
MLAAINLLFLIKVGIYCKHRENDLVNAQEKYLGHRLPNKKIPKQIIKKAEQLNKPNKKVKEQNVPKNNKKKEANPKDVQTSPIASLVIPDIQPIIDVITIGSAQILNRITLAKDAKLLEIKAIIDGHIDDQSGEIIFIVNQGNHILESDINQAFHHARIQIDNDINQITNTEKSSASGNVRKFNKLMEQQIKDKIHDVEDLIKDAVHDAMSQDIEALIDALTTANNSLYTQIQEILNDESNINPVIPQLVYADASEIASLYVSSTDDIYAAILAIVNQLMIDINTIITTNTGLSVDEQNIILNSANNEILRSLNVNIDIAMQAIWVSINNVLTNEINFINGICNGVENIIKNDIKDALHNLEGQVKYIIDDVTEQQVMDTWNLITDNNNYVKDFVDIILRSS